MNWLIRMLGGYTKGDMSYAVIELENQRLSDLEIERQEKFRVGDIVYNHSKGYSNNMYSLYVHKVRLGLRNDIVLELGRNKEDDKQLLIVLAKNISYEKPDICSCCGKKQN